MAIVHNLWTKQHIIDDLFAFFKANKQINTCDHRFRYTFFFLSNFPIVYSFILSFQMRVLVPHEHPSVKVNIFFVSCISNDIFFCSIFFFFFRFFFATLSIRDGIFFLVRIFLFVWYVEKSKWWAKNQQKMKTKLTEC